VPYPTQIVQDCKKDESCADAFLSAPYFALNTSVACYYDPTNCPAVAFVRGYTWWYWFLWAFPTVSLLVLMNYWTYHFFVWKLKKTLYGIMAYLFTWWFILFPLVFLLSIALATRDEQVPPASKTGVLVFALCLMGVTVIAICVLFYIFIYSKKRGGSSRGNTSENISYPIKNPTESNFATKPELNMGAGIEMRVTEANKETSEVSGSSSGSNSGSKSSKSAEPVTAPAFVVYQQATQQVPDVGAGIPAGMEANTGIMGIEPPAGGESPDGSEEASATGSGSGSGSGSKSKSKSKKSERSADYSSDKVESKDTSASNDG